LGYRSQCKPCRIAKASDWYEANRERQRANLRALRAADGDRLRAEDRARYYRDKPKRMLLVEDTLHQRRAAAAGVPAVKGITKQALRDRHGDLCCYCGAVMDFEPGDRTYNPLRASIEHVVSLSAGGAHDWHNVRLACLACNIGKHGHRSAEEWLQVLQGRRVGA
jgi:5-methylcytosine-specific restriction endonuclease McrA